MATQYEGRGLHVGEEPMNTKRSKRSARRQRANSVDATKGQYVSFDASFEQGTEPNSWLCGDGRVRAELMIGHWPRLLPSQPFSFANILESYGLPGSFVSTVAIPGARIRD